jgi:hypothetical protein
LQDTPSRRQPDDAAPGDDQIVCALHADVLRELRYFTPNSP